MHIFVFIALSYSRASSHKACKATCKIIFLYCVVKKQQPTNPKLVWLNTDTLVECTSTMHYREDRLWEIYTFWICLSPDWRDWVGLLWDQWQWTNLQRHYKVRNESRHTNFKLQMCLIHVKKSRCVIFCRTYIVFTPSSKQPRYQVVKSTINGWGYYFPCRFPSLAEIAFNIFFWLELLNALDLHEMANEVIKNPTNTTITDPHSTSLRYECCIFFCYTDGILALVWTPVNVDSLEPKDGTAIKWK